MFKTFWFSKRKPGMSWEDFYKHYETKHRMLGEKAMAGEAISYIRHYLHPVSPDAPEPVYDFVMELCFPDRESYERMKSKLMSDKELSAAIAEDEARFLDRSSIVHYVVEDVASVLKASRPRKPHRTRQKTRAKPRQPTRKRALERRASSR
jgi:hypothetical protein